MKTLRIPVNPDAYRYKDIGAAPTHEEVRAYTDPALPLVLTKSLDGNGYEITHRLSGKRVCSADTIRVGKEMISRFLFAPDALDWNLPETKLTKAHGQASKNVASAVRVWDYEKTCAVRSTVRS